MSDPVVRLNAALEGRYAIARELGEGGMAKKVRAIYDHSLNPQEPGVVVRSSLTLPDDRRVSLSSSLGGFLTLSPDGGTVVYRDPRSPKPLASSAALM